jgi:hypothetical protein
VTERQKDRKTERQKDRKTERQKDRKTERQKDRKTERQKDRQKDRKTERQKDRQAIREQNQRKRFEDNFPVNFFLFSFSQNLNLNDFEKRFQKRRHKLFFFQEKPKKMIPIDFQRCDILKQGLYYKTFC